MITADIITDKGTMKVEFFDKDAPGTVGNFVKLSKEGFYNGLTFRIGLKDLAVFLDSNREFERRGITCD